MKVLVSGGMGYIGTHTVVELLELNYDVFIVDNLYNSQIDVLDNIKKITNKDNVKFYSDDFTNYDALNDIFKKEKIYAVIHFAGYKAVVESVEKPLMYYYNNLNKTITLARLAEEYKIKHLSSHHQQLFMVIKNPLYMKH